MRTNKLWIALPASLKRSFISTPLTKSLRGNPPSRKIPSGLSCFAQQHEMVMGSDGDVDEFYEVQERDLAPKPPDNNLIHVSHATSIQKNMTHPGDLHSMMSSPKQPPTSKPVCANNTPTASVHKEVIIDGKKYYYASINDESPCQ